MKWHDLQKTVSKFAPFLKDYPQESALDQLHSAANKD